MSDHQFPSRVGRYQVPFTAMQTRDPERGIFAETSHKGGGRKHETILNLLLLNQQLGRAGVPNLIYENYLGAFPILKRPNYVRNSIIVYHVYHDFFLIEINW